MGKSALEIIGLEHVTTHFLSWSSMALLLMLIGLLINSCHKEFYPPNPLNPKG